MMLTSLQEQAFEEDDEYQQLFQQRPVVLLVDFLKHGLPITSSQHEASDPVKVFLCHVCDVKYTDRLKMSAHIAVSHGTSCHICGKQYGRIKCYKLIKHFKKFHQNPDGILCHAAARFGDSDSQSNPNHSADRNLEIYNKPQQSGIKDMVSFLSTTTPSASLRRNAQHNDQMDNDELRTDKRHASSSKTECANYEIADSQTAPVPDSSEEKVDIDSDAIVVEEAVYIKQEPFESEAVVSMCSLALPLDWDDNEDADDESRHSTAVSDPLSRLKTALNSMDKKPLSKPPTTSNALKSFLAESSYIARNSPKDVNRSSARLSKARESHHTSKGSNEHDGMNSTILSASAGTDSTCQEPLTSLAEIVAAVDGTTSKASSTVTKAADSTTGSLESEDEMSGYSSKQYSVPNVGSAATAAPVATTAPATKTYVMTTPNVPHGNLFYAGQAQSMISKTSATFDRLPMTSTPAAAHSFYGSQLSSENLMLCKPCQQLFPQSKALDHICNIHLNVRTPIQDNYTSYNPTISHSQAQQPNTIVSPATLNPKTQMTQVSQASLSIPIGSKHPTRISKHKPFLENVLNDLIYCALCKYTFHKTRAGDHVRQHHGGILRKAINQMRPTGPTLTTITQNHTGNVDNPVQNTLHNQTSHTIALRCSTCSFMTYDADVLASHSKTHTLSLKHCSFCDYVTLFFEDLDAHTSSYHKWKKCSLCSFTTRDNAELNDHVSLVHLGIT